MKQAVSFTEGPVRRQLYRMAIPMVWGLLATMSFNAIDTFFVAQLGTDALAAMSFTFPVVMLVTSMAIGLGAGTSSVMARLLGQGDMANARQVAGDTLLLALALSLAMMLLGWLTIDPLFLLLGAKPELLPLIRDYMGIWYLNTPFVIVSLAISSMMRATGNNRVAGGLMLIAALLNALLDPLLIFGWGAFPRLEMAGAAWATVITRVLLGIVFLYFVTHRLRLVSWPHRQLSSLRRSWRAVLHIGAPAMGSNMIGPFASGITVALVAQYGVDAVAGFGVAMRIEPVVLIVFYALSGVAGPFLGQNMAVRYRHRQGEALTVILRFCILFGLGVALLLWLVAQTVSQWFSDSPAIVAVAVAYLSITPVSYGLYGLVMSVNASFNGLGHPMPSVVISVSRALAVYLPLALLGQWLWGLEGVFVATAMSNMLVGVLGYFWLRRTLRQ